MQPIEEEIHSSEEEVHSSEGLSPQAADMQRLSSESLRVKQEFLNVSVKCLSPECCLSQLPIACTKSAAGCMLLSVLPGRAGGYLNACALHSVACAEAWAILLLAISCGGARGPRQRDRWQAAETGELVPVT